MRRARLTIACNFSPNPHEVPCNHQASDQVLLASAGVELQPDLVMLPPETVAVIGPAEF
jgi:hypothetical protein